ncbi:MAG: hypothetical protein K2X03_25135 [Bryobacteraceae bacterium]|nr:hypothetical protein [Bryobacteraceae bacterium]
MPAAEEPDWPTNYFNYFTEIEEHFQRARGTSLFLLSPLDWALIETWKNGGIPLEAVRRGIERAFEKWRASKRRQAVNSLAYCTQAVMEEAEIMEKGGISTASAPVVDAPFSVEELRTYLSSNAELVAAKGWTDLARSLSQLAAEAELHHGALEELELRLTVIEEKLLAEARSAQSEEQLLKVRREMENSLRPYRGKMTADQLSRLERQFLDRAVLEQAGLRRLSLFYLH